MNYYLSVLDEDLKLKQKPVRFASLEMAQTSAKKQFVKRGEQPRWSYRGHPHQPDAVEMITPSIHVVIESEKHMDEAGDTTRTAD